MAKIIEKWLQSLKSVSSKNASDLGYFFVHFYVSLTMIKNKKILLKIKRLVNLSEPSATIILYGSHARRQNNKQSDIDILILVDYDKITYSDEQRIKYPLYDLEFETGKVISPVVFSRNDWETRHTITPFYKNVKKDGVKL